MRTEIRSLNLEELTALATECGEKPFRGKQLFEWIHAKRVQDFTAMTNLSKGFRDKLKENYTISPLKLVTKQISDDRDTEKYLFSLEDGETIECVWMSYRHGDSICVSSQVGCRMSCSFCASTIDGMKRNLTAGEMLSQIYDIEREHYGEPGTEGEKSHISSIIVMGMGEPFDNFENVVKFVRLLTDERGRNLSARGITISTCGLPDGIRRLADEELPVTLALSLHAPNDALRGQLMPIARTNPLKEVLSSCRYYFEKTGRRITFEYSMIEGINDGEGEARELSELADDMRQRGCPVHINLIPLNPVMERKYRRSEETNIERFKKILEKNRINVTIRREMGSGIDAACGQLKRRAEKS